MDKINDNRAKATLNYIQFDTFIRVHKVHVRT